MSRINIFLSIHIPQCILCSWKHWPSTCAYYEHIHIPVGESISLNSAMQKRGRGRWMKLRASVHSHSAKCAIEDTAMTATKTLLQYRYQENCESFGEADGNKKISPQVRNNCSPLRRHFPPSQLLLLILNCCFFSCFCFCVGCCC